ncbi:hypothetical protein BJX70DRAFT_338067 [Aspergillus crustosus]
MSQTDKECFMKYLESDTVCLETAGSSRHFRIHRKLLASKSKPIASAFERPFAEASSNTYVFQETLESTLGKFMEWAYTGDYPNPPHVVVEGQLANWTASREKWRKANKKKASETKADPEAVNAPTINEDNDPLLVNIHVYIFATVYLIPDLQTLSMKRATSVIKSKDHSYQHANTDMLSSLYDCLRLAFESLQDDDELRKWLTSYAAYALSFLGQQPEFQQLLQDYPVAAAHMVPLLKPAGKAPWMTDDPPPAPKKTLTGGFKCSWACQGGRHPKLINCVIGNSGLAHPSIYFTY